MVTRAQPMPVIGHTVDGNRIVKTSKGELKILAPHQSNVEVFYVPPKEN